jgi:hypothetical protein
VYSNNVSEFDKILQDLSAKEFKNIFIMNILGTIILVDYENWLLYNHFKFLPLIYKKDSNYLSIYHNMIIAQMHLEIIELLVKHKYIDLNYLSKLYNKSTANLTCYILTQNIYYNTDKCVGVIKIFKDFIDLEELLRTLLFEYFLMELYIRVSSLQKSKEDLNLKSVMSELVSDEKFINICSIISYINNKYNVKFMDKDSFLKLFIGIYDTEMSLSFITFVYDLIYNIYDYIYKGIEKNM